MPTTSDQRWPRAIDLALEKVVDVSGLDLAFGAQVRPDGRHLTIARFRGARTTALQDLVVHRGTGLGGKALAFRRPVAVADYVHAKGISHEYDIPVSREGMHSILAVPVLVSGRVTGVIDGALRQRLPIGDRTQQTAMAIARETGQSLTDNAPPVEQAHGGMTLSEVYAELSSILARTSDPVSCVVSIWNTLSDSSNKPSAGPHPRIRTPEAADQWTWLMIAAHTQLRLARHLVEDLPRPWERHPATPARLSATRVRRGFRRVRQTTATPTNPPKPSRPGPGRPTAS